MYEVGDRVFGRVGIQRFGSLGEFVVAPRESLAHVPEGVTLEDASSLATAAATDFDIEPGNASGRRLCLLECVVTPLVVKGHDGRRADHLCWAPLAPVPALKRPVGRCLVLPLRLQQHFKGTSPVLYASLGGLVRKSRSPR